MKDDKKDLKNFGLSHKDSGSVRIGKDRWAACGQAAKDLHEKITRRDSKFLVSR